MRSVDKQPFFRGINGQGSYGRCREDYLNSGYHLSNPHGRARCPAMSFHVISLGAVSIIIPFYRWGNRVSGKSDLPNIAQLARNTSLHFYHHSVLNTQHLLPGQLQVLRMLSQSILPTEASCNFPNANPIMLLPCVHPFDASSAVVIAIKIISMVLKVLPGWPQPLPQSHPSPAPLLSTQVILATLQSPEVPLLLSVTGSLHLPSLPPLFLD